MSSPWDDLRWAELVVAWGVAMLPPSRPPQRFAEPLLRADGVWCEACLVRHPAGATWGGAVFSVCPRAPDVVRWEAQSGRGPESS